ncbi:hypothetical protein CCP2SC5_1590004 [Azospirillaceae bacterium]
MNRVREAIKMLLTGTSEESLLKQINEVKLELTVDDLVKNGHIDASPEIRDIATAALAGTATPEQIITLLQKPKTITPTETIVPSNIVDPVEAQIRNEMATKNLSYADAAVEVSAGGTLNA